MATNKPLEIVVRMRADMTWSDALKFRIAGADVFREWLRQQLDSGEHDSDAKKTSEPQ